MTPTIRGLGLAATLVLVSTFTVVPKARAASTPSTAAYVYIQIQGSAGAVYGLSASSTGQLSAIPSAPWKPSGLIVGSTPTKFFSLGADLIHSYGIASNGAILSQLAEMPILDYDGSGCGGGSTGQDGAVLDHTGKYIYVMLEGNLASEDCVAYQSYIVNSDGSFLFDGDTELDWEPYGGYQAGLPSILGSESFAYSQYLYNSGPQIMGFRRESSGTLDLLSDLQINTPTSSGQGYVPTNPDASPAGNYVVIQLYPEDAPPGQLGSFTVNSEGNLSSTNTASNMPTTPFSSVTGTTFSPSGNMFVIYSNSGTGTGLGIEIYNFNGAAPLTAYKTLLSGTPIDQVAWDSSNHLYAISKSGNELYVFTVTPTSVTQDASWSIGSPYKMVVVSE